jgi:ABC-type amino acid transport substrate-binding protein
VASHFRRSGDRIPPPGKGKPRLSIGFFPDQRSGTQLALYSSGNSALRYVYANFALLAFALTLSAGPVRAADRPTVFFFSPDYSSGNLSLLTQAAENYLRESGFDARFQPFVRFDDLRREYRAQRPEFIIVPAWVPASGCLDPKLLPIVKPVRGGEYSGQKALIVPPSVQRSADLSGATVAATVPPGGSSEGSGLDRLRREHPGVRVVAVPKDIDAILAVAFGQANAAYVSTRQFGLFAVANPKLGGALREFGYTESMPFPMIYATAYATDDRIAQLKNVALSAAELGSGKRLVDLLGYDGWVAVERDEPAPKPDVRASAACASIEENGK